MHLSKNFTIISLENKNPQLKKRLWQSIHWRIAPCSLQVGLPQVAINSRIDSLWAHLSSRSWKSTGVRGSKIKPSFLHPSTRTLSLTCACQPQAWIEMQNNMIHSSSPSFLIIFLNPTDIDMSVVFASACFHDSPRSKEQQKTLFSPSLRFTELFSLFHSSFIPLLILKYLQYKKS